MSQKIYTDLDIKGNTTIGSIANATTDTDKFLVSDNGLVKYRTGAEMLSDLGIDAGAPTSSIQHQVKAAVVINKGQAVYVSGADGTNMIVSLASNATEATSSKTMGLLADTVAINGFSNVVAEGLLTGLNTSTAAAGDPVWLGTGGNLIYGLINKPYAPAHLVFIGIVTRSNNVNGEIFVKVQNGFELNEIHDVDLKTTVPINGHILGFDGSLWVNKTIAGWLGYTPYNASNPAGYISSYSETDTLQTVTSRGATTNLAITALNYVFTGASSGAIGLVTSASSFGTRSGDGTTYGYGISTNISGGLDIMANQSGQPIRFWAGTTNVSPIQRMIISNGDVTASDSFRAPIFYDSGNTAYYLNPNGGSNLLNVTANTFVKSGGTASQILAADGSVITAGTNITISGGVISSTDTNTVYTHPAYTARSIDTSGAQVIDVFTSDAIGSVTNITTRTMTLADIGAAAASHTHTFDSLTSKTGGTGTYQTSGDFRAPIFYDSNDTGYYINPNSTSNINGLYAVDIRARKSQADNNYTTAALWTESYNNTTTGIAFHISGVVGKFLEMRTNGYLYWENNRVVTQDGGTWAINVSGNAASASSVAWGNITSKPTLLQVNGNNNTLNSITEDGTTYWAAGATNAPSTYGSLLTVTGGIGWYNQLGFTTGDSMVFRQSINNTTSWTAWKTILDSSNVGSYAAPISHTHTFDSLTSKSSGTGTYQTSGDFRAPIFYDTNNTGFYVDPAGTSNISKAYHTGNIVATNYGYGQIGLYSSVRYQAVFSMGEAYVLPVDGTTAGNLYGMAWSHPNAGGVAGNLNTHGLLVMENGTFLAAISGSIRSRDDMRAPIFYDSNNTGYFIDPTSTSNLVGLTVANTISGNITGNSGTVSSITGNTGLMVNSLVPPANIDGLTTTNFRSTLFGTTSNGWQISTARWNNVPAPLSGLNQYSTMLAWSGSDTQGFLAMDYNTPAAIMGGGNANNINWSRRVLLEDVWTNNKLFSSNGDIYGTIFYDTNNTTYYINPSDATKSINVAGKVTVNVGSSAGTPVLEAVSTYGTMSINTYYGVLHTSGDFYIGNPASSGNNLYGNQARFGSFIDRNNSAYYLTPSSTSVLNRLSISFSDATYQSGITVTNTNTGAQAVAGVNMFSGVHSGSINMFSSGYMDLLNQNTTNGTIQFRPKATVSMYIDNVSSTSRVTIGGSNPASHPLRVTQQVSNVSIYADYDIVAYSDQSVKENIRPIENVLDRVNKSRGVLYDRIDSGEKNNIGFIAQELEVEFPELVVTNEDNTKAVKYQNAVAVLFEAVKEQQKQIEELKELVNKLITK